jgi:WD40 repeat protein
VSLWDVASGNLIQQSDRLFHQLQALAFTRQSKSLILIPYHGAIRKLSLPDLKPQAELEVADSSQEITAGAFARGGQLGVLAHGFHWTILMMAQQIASSTKQEISLIDTKSLRCLQLSVIPDASGIQSLAIDPDAQWLFIGEGNGTLRFVDLAKGQLLGTVQEHGAAVDALSLSSDGRYLISASQDQMVRVWDVARREPVASLVCPEEEQFVFVCEEGYYAASASGLRAIAFQMGQRSLPAETYDVRNNRPDLVLGPFEYTYCISC